MLTLEDIDKPSPKRGEALVKIKAVALNHLDLFVRRGIPGMKLPLPMIPGSDMAGVVESLGEGTDEKWKDKRVIINPGFGCGKCHYCREGETSLCAKYHIFGELCDGGYGEYISVPEEQLLEMPEKVTFEEAAAFPLVFLTAWRMMVRKAQVRPLEDVLVLGGGAGVGMAVIQICKLFGARVIATASTEEKLEKLRELGVDKTINYVENPDFHRDIRGLTGGKGADIVVDYIGKDTWVKSMKSLRQGGRLVTCGATTGPFPKTDLRHIFFRQLTVYGSTMGSHNDLEAALSAWKAGKLKPLVDRVLPLEEAAKAHKLLEDRKVFGKVVLRVEEA